LGVGVQQAKQLNRGYRCEGEASSQRSKRRCWRHADFGATLASEKLGEIEGVSVRRPVIQIRLGLWRPKRRAPKRFSRFANADRALANSSRSTGVRMIASRAGDRAAR
jgi:hypothetical protein